MRRALRGGLFALSHRQRKVPLFFSATPSSAPTLAPLFSLQTLESVITEFSDFVQNKIQISDESKQLLGTGGGLKFARKYLLGNVKVCSKIKKRLGFSISFL
jgi:hypothetical protein